MPLLLCPNDNAAMQTVKRNGVEFDICPTCRGVWLDRGELENLMSPAGNETATPPARASERGYERGERGAERRDDDDDGYRQGQSQRRRRGLDIFDIFD